MKGTDIIIGMSIALGIFIAFGATFTEMATNTEYGYPVDVSDSFGNSYMNITKAQNITGNLAVIGYNMSDSQRYTVYGDNVVVDSIGGIINSIRSTFTFVREFIRVIFQAIGLPPIIFDIMLTIIIITIGALIIKATFNREV
jgi:hypothetical protein